MSARPETTSLETRQSRGQPWPLLVSYGDADLSVTDNDEGWFWTLSLYLSSRQERDRMYPGRLIC